MDNTTKPLTIEKVFGELTQQEKAMLAKNAIEIDNPILFESLIKSGLEILDTDNTGKTVFQYAFESKNQKFLSSLSADKPEIQKSPALGVLLAAKTLQSEYKNPYHRQRLIEISGLNAFDLEKHFEQLVGVSTQRYSKQLRIEECIRIKKEEGISLQEAAVAVGYRGMEKFYQDYKTITGKKLAFSNSKVAKASIKDRILMCTKWMETHYLEPYNGPELARRFHIHPNIFSSYFKGLNHMTPLKYHTRLRLLEIQRLVKEMNMPVMQAIKIAGFKQYSHYYRASRKMFGNLMRYAGKNKDSHE